jgi:hypothetical protein
MTLIWSFGPSIFFVYYHSAPLVPKMQILLNINPSGLPEISADPNSDSLLAT